MRELDCLTQRQWNLYNASISGAFGLSETSMTERVTLNVSLQFLRDVVTVLEQATEGAYCFPSYFGVTTFYEGETRAGEISRLADLFRDKLREGEQQALRELGFEAAPTGDLVTTDAQREYSGRYELDGF